MKTAANMSVPNIRPCPHHTPHYLKIYDILSGKLVSEYTSTSARVDSPAVIRYVMYHCGHTCLQKHRYICTDHCFYLFVYPVLDYFACPSATNDLLLCEAALWDMRRPGGHLHKFDVLHNSARGCFSRTGYEVH